MTRRSAVLWGVLLAAVLAGALVVGIPVWLIQPFAPQTPAAVDWSWSLRRVAPAVTTVAALLALVSALRLWRAPARPNSRAGGAGRRVVLVGLLAISAASTWFARQNHFEWMFRPFPDPRFVAAAEAGVDAGEPVLGVAAGTTALAFPITRLGYHHLVNATLGATPIVATY